MKYTPRKVISQDIPVRLTLAKHPITGTEFSTVLHPPEINPGADIVFPDPIHRSWKIAPPYGKSFKKVLQSREIKMTPYNVGKISDIRYVAGIPRYETVAEGYQWNAICHKGKPYVSPQQVFGTATTRYEDQYDLTRASEVFPVVEYSDYPSSELINFAIDEVKAKVVGDTYSGFDALTELAELPETLGMLLSLFKAALRPLQGIKALREKYERAKRRGKTHSEAHAEIASQWMQYRYGIMPLVYSIQDAIELLDEAFAEFKTDKTFVVLSSKPRLKAPSDKTHVAVYRAHEIKVSAVAKAKFATHTSRLTDLITTNLFVTAWELIPMSFVIDWFINVGDVIQSRTSGMASLAEERKFCCSIRRTIIDKYVLNYNITNGLNWSREDTLTLPCGAPGVDYGRKFTPFNNVSEQQGSVILREFREESYERFIFQPNSVSLKFQPSLNWQRMIDGYVLSFNSTSKQLRKFR